MHKRIFLDTNPFIYLIEDIEPFSQKVDDFILSEGLKGAEFYTSTITDTEFLVQPYKIGKMDVINAYWTFLKDFDILKCFINEKIAIEAAKLRAKYDSIKTDDSLQLAASLEAGCDVFLTNDKQLKQVSEAKVVLVDDL